jgi:uncharacterized protein
MSLPSYLTDLGDGRCVLDLQVIPGARKDEIVGIHGDALKLKTAAPPVEGAANDQIVRYLSRQVLSLSRGAVHIISGEHSRRKRVEIQAPAAQVLAALQKHL